MQRRKYTDTTADATRASALHQLEDRPVSVCARRNQRRAYLEVATEAGRMIMQGRLSGSAAVAVLHRRSPLDHVQTVELILRAFRLAAAGYAGRRKPREAAAA